MKAIRVEMVDIQPMSYIEAYEKQLHPRGNVADSGFLITHQDGSTSWISDEKADSTLYCLTDDSKIVREDVEKFITGVDTLKVGEKTTVVNAHTLTGFDTVRHSSCVDPKNYSEEIGRKFAMENVISDLWGHLGFVLQWAKFGLKRN